MFVFLQVLLNAFDLIMLFSAGLFVVAWLFKRFMYTYTQLLEKAKLQPIYR